MPINRFPLDATEGVVFRPECLAEIAPEIGFMLGTPSRRAKRAFDALCDSEGMILHRPDDFRDQFIRAVKALSLSSEEAEKHVETLKRFWDAQDQYNQSLREHIAEQAMLPEAERTPFSDFEDDDADAAQMIMEEVEPRWPPLARMNGQNTHFASEHPRICLSVVLEGVEGIDVPLARVDFYKGAKRVAIESIDAIEESLVERFGEALGMTAFKSLLVEAIGRIFLSRNAEKNLPSPQPLTPIQQDSTTVGAESGSTSQVSEPLPNPPDV